MSGRDRVRVMVVERNTDRGRNADQKVSLQNALYAPKVLGGRPNLAALPRENHNLDAGVAAQVNVGRELDMLSPMVLRGRESSKYVRRGVPVEQHHGPNRVRVRVGDRIVRQLLANQEPDRIRPARRVSHSDPAVESVHEGGLQ